MWYTSTSPGANAERRRVLAMRAGTILLIVLISCGRSSAYSVLTHEEIVDLLWTDEIRPLLLKRYPGLSEDQIRQAHAYAYGARSSRIWATIRSATRSSAIWCTTYAAATSSANFFSKARMRTSTPSRWALSHTMRLTSPGTLP